MQPCQICGNKIDISVLCCPYCRSVQDADNGDKFGPKKKKFYQKTINLEQGLPTVAQALSRLQLELISAELEQIRVLTCIHGYGSSGKGGAIRQECRKTLEYRCAQGEIKEVIYGENFTRRNGSVKQLLNRFPVLNRHSHLNRSNKGITLVVLS